MKMVKSLLLGSAAGLVAVAGAQAADLPVKAKPVQYVKICSLYGAGFYYIPGTDTCIKIGGFVRAEWNYQAANSFKPRLVYNFDDPARDRYNERTRGGITFDVRSQTAYGTLRAYGQILPTFSEDGGNGGNAYTPTMWSTTAGGTGFVSPGVFTPALFIQFAGFTFGKTASFFDFDTNGYTNATVYWGSSQAGNGTQVFAYTAQFGNGISASIAAEDTTVRRSQILMGVAGGITTGVALTAAGVPGAPAANNFGYGGRRWPDIVANLRIDQAWGSAQIMGAIHDVYANAGAGVTSSETGYAVGAGLRINLPMIGAGDYLLGQVNYSKGVTNYVMNQSSSGGAIANLAEGFPVVNERAYGYVADAVLIPGGNLDLTTGWSVTAGFEHVWSPQWKTSLYGSYGEFNYSNAASLQIAKLAVGVGGIVNTLGSTSADWSMWQIGTRTVWTPVQNLDLSVDVLYSKVNTGFDGTNVTPAGVVGAYTLRDEDIVSAMFRAQRNFWP